MKRFIIFSLFLFLAIVTLFAEIETQYGDLFVNVYSGKKYRLKYANVVLFKDGTNTHIGGLSNGKGMCKITEIPTGMYDIRISRMGYKNQIVDSVLVQANHRTAIEVHLEKRSKKHMRYIHRPYHKSIHRSLLRYARKPAVVKILLDQIEWENN